MINGNNMYWHNAAMNNRKDEDEWKAAKDTVPAPSELGTKEITENGNYSAKDDGLDGYSSVDVDVANTYTAEDEGKVVSDGALVAQTAYPTEITENDTYDTTNYNSITVNVSGGGGGGNVVAYFDMHNNGYLYYLEDENNVIGENAFYDCPELSSITIPNGVISIGESAFYFCQALTSITIPNSVTSIGNNAFGNCTSLETITFESNSSLESIGDSAFYDCQALSSIAIPNSVTYIGGDAFYYCYALTSITIPNSVTSIGSNAFYDCSALETITFESTTPPTLNGDLGLPTTCTIRVPQGTLSDYTSASYYPDPSEYTYEEY